MAKGKGSIKGWITRNGVHIPIYGEYTVRQGHEPENVKGAKFKGKKKKRENWNVDHVRQDIFQSNTSVKEQADYINYLHKKGKINDEEKATLSKELADRHKNRISEDVGNITSSESKQAFDDKTPGRTAQREKDAEKRTEIAKERQEKDKYTDRDWNKDVDDSKRYGYSEQSENGKKPVTKAEESSKASSTPDFSNMSYSEAGKYVSEHRKEFGLKANDDAYMAAYEMKKGTWKQPETKKGMVSTTESYPATKSFGSSEPSADEYGKAMDDIKERYTSERKTVAGKDMGSVFEGLKPGDQIQIHNKYSTSPDRYTVNADGTIDYTTPSSSFLGKSGMSLAEAQKHATNDVNNSITIMRKKGTEEQASSKESIATKSDIVDRVKNMSIDEKKDFAMAATKQTLENKQQNKGIERRNAEFKTTLSTAKENVANGEHTIDIATNGTKSEIDRAKRTIKDNAKKNDVDYGISQHKGVVTGSRTLEGGSSFDSAIRNMSVSGLKDAYNTATGSEKAKIRARLHSLGYTYVGGRWVKGK